MAWTEFLIIAWSALFVVSVAIAIRSNESPSRFARPALLFAGVSVLALLGVVLWGLCRHLVSAIRSLVASAAAIGFTGTRR